MSDKKYKHLFGPVPSRRLGLSLGVDIIPFKVCTIDCVYCQLGRTLTKTTERKEYVPVEPVIAELKTRLAEGVKADYITISGSGEPTLNSRIGDFIKAIKEITDIPVAVITNATLFSDKAVREACALADLVVPSLDAADDEAFGKINRPCAGLNVAQHIAGLCAFRDEYAGAMWLEVFVIDGINTGEEQLAKLAAAIERIRPDKVQLNTAVRPTAESGIQALSFEKMQAIAARLGGNCEIVASFSREEMEMSQQVTEENVLETIERRPCSLEDICAGLGIHRNEALKYIGHLEKDGAIEAERKGDVVYYRVMEK